MKNKLLIAFTARIHTIAASGHLLVALLIIHQFGDRILLEFSS